MKKVISIMLTTILLFTVVQPLGYVWAEKDSSNEKPDETYSARYIIKYAQAPQEKTALKDEAKKAFQKAKKRKDEMVLALSEEESREQYKYSDERFLIKEKEMENSVETAAQINQDGTQQYEVIQLEEAVSAEVFIEELEQRAGGMVEYIQPDYEMTLSAGSTALSSLTLEELPDLEELAQSEEVVSIEEEAMEPTTLEETAVPTETEPEETISTSNRQVTVALLDTGVDMNHPDLANHLVGGYDFYHNTSEVAVQENSLADVHGTHLAGVIAQSAPNVKIMPLKVFDNGHAYTSDIIRAITYAEEQGATIVNCSWGSTENNPALREAMENSSMFFVCAAGNNRVNLVQTPIYPASYGLPNSISVAAVNDDRGMSYFSNYGTSVDIAARGRNVESTYPGGGTGIMNGTSVSAGFVTGAAAAYAAVYGRTSLKEALTVSADKLSCLENKVRDGNSLNKENLLARAAGQTIFIQPEDDFDVLGYERTPAENWELFSQQDNIQVVATPGNSYFLKSNGSVWACGDDDSTPTQIVGLTGIISMSASYYGCLFLSNEGLVYEGGSTDGVPMPKNGLTGVTMVAAGYGGQFLVAKNDGTVWGWGENYCGEAGNSEPIVNGNILEGYVSSNIPAQVGGGVSYPKRLVGGNGTSYAIDQNDTLWHWGIRGRYFNDLSCSAAILTENVREVSLPGNTFYFGVKNDGTAFYNVANSGLATLDTTDFSDAAYLDHNVMVKTDGSVWTWDDNFTVSQINGINNVKLVSQAQAQGSASPHTLALKNDGTVWGWGNNDKGQLGDNGSGTITSPVQIGVPVMETPGTVLVDEQYDTAGNAAYRKTQSGLETLGWSEYENPAPGGNDWQSSAYGEFSAETGQLIMKKTSADTQPAAAGSNALVYSMDKTFTQRIDNWQGDSRVSRWKQNFKGKYSIELSGYFPHNRGVVYYDMLGRSSNGTSTLVGRYRVDWMPSHQFGVYNNKLNGGTETIYPLWLDADQMQTVKTTFDSFSSTFQTFLNDSTTPCSTTTANAYPKDTFSMTGWNTAQPGAYLTGIRISAQKYTWQNDTIAVLNSIKLVEHQAAQDVTDTAAADLTMDMLTDTPANVQESLKTLPTTLDGANITWSSSNPKILADDGTLQQGAVRPTDVVMTAKMTNPVDGFTQYLDFRLTVTATDGKTLVEERYNDQSNNAYQLDQSGLEQLGWSECENPIMTSGEAYNANLGEFSASSGVLTMKKTGTTAEPVDAGSTSLVYGIQKTFTYRQDNWNNDPRVSVWTQHFKGDYMVEIDGSFHQTGSQLYYDILGNSSNGTPGLVGRYRVDPGTTANFSVYNNKLNGGNVTSYPLFINPTQRRIIATQLCSEDSTFQTFVNNASTPSKTTVPDANPDDTFSMTGWNTAQPGAYLTGIRISAQKQAPADDTSAKLYTLRLVEVEPQRDIVDDAIDQLSMNMVTDTPSAVTGDLKPLPQTLAGANIIWTSSNPELLSDSGELIGNVVYDTDVVLTAKLTNPIDGFTKYMDFRLTVTKTGETSPLEPVTITALENPALYAALKRERTNLDSANTGVITPAELGNITGTLDLSYAGLSSIDGLQSCDSIHTIYLDHNEITELSPLRGLENLNTVIANHNLVQTVPSLAGTPLLTLDLEENQITDVSLLGVSTTLKTLFLGGNQISDASGLATLTGLQTLKMDRNALTNIEFVSGMLDLRYLNASNNQITSVQPVRPLRLLYDLRLSYNDITDITPLRERFYRYLYLDHNRLNTADVLEKLAEVRVANLWYYPQKTENE